MTTAWCSDDVIGAPGVVNYGLAADDRHREGVVMTGVVNMGTGDQRGLPGGIVATAPESTSGNLVGLVAT